VMCAQLSMQNIYMTIPFGLSIRLEDGSQSKQTVTEKIWVNKLGHSHYYYWYDLAGRYCQAEDNALFPNNFL
jgi:hypothetical protein